MGSGVQNVRFLRFFIVLGAIVILTLFIYASYNSNKSALPHIRNGAPPMTSLMQSFRNHSINLKETKNTEDTTVYLGARKQVFGTNNISHRGVNIGPFKYHRQPTIDVEAPAEFDVEELLEERVIKDQQFSDTYNTSLLQSPQLQEPEYSKEKIQENDYLIPTSNLQKFIESADKLLKNITIASVTVQPMIRDVTPSKKQDGAEVSVANTHQSDLPAIRLFPKNVNSSSYVITKKNSTTAAVLDPTQGIPTVQIYEGGHRDEELSVERICPDAGRELKLLIMITSAQSHLEARLAIRQTWGHYSIRRDVSMVFVLGRTTNETLNKLLQQENFLYGDLIRGNFLDTYNNLTLKTISALEWVDRHCPRTKHILKTDDDMFINVPKLLNFLEKHSQEKRVIYGRLAKKWKPIRNKKSKYYVSAGQFSATTFPAFTTGPAYVMSADTIHDLYQKALQQTYLKLEDVFTTGIVAQHLGIKRVHVNEFLNRRISFNVCNIRKTISVHMIKANEQFDLWKKLLDQTTKCK